MAQILILSLVFPPDNVSTAQLMGDLSSDLLKAGHSVRVLTTMPHYNPGSIAGSARLGRWWLGASSVYHGVPVFHTWMPSKGRNALYRISTWMLFHMLSTTVGCFIGPRPDVILCPSPPLSIGLSAWIIAVVRRAKFIYNVQEIYPDVAVNLGVVRSRLIIQCLRQLERFVYRKAVAITTISPKMRENILCKGVEDKKVRVIPNCVDLSNFEPSSKVNSFSAAHGLGAEFVVGYAGNMGKPQQLDVFVQAAAAVQDQRIKFVLMGSGSETGRLREIIEGCKLQNVLFLPQQPYEVMREAYATFDLCYVPQALGTSVDGIPSKIYRILGCAKPVLALTDYDSDLAELVRRSESGVVVHQADAGLIGRAVSEAACQPDRFAEYGRNGRRYVERFYDRKSISRSYAELVTEICGRHR